MFSFSLTETLLEISLAIFIYRAYKILTQQGEKKLNDEEKLQLSLLVNLKNAELYKEKPENIWTCKHGFFKKKSIKQIEQQHHFQWKEDIFTTAENIAPIPIAKIASELQPYFWDKLFAPPRVYEFQYRLNHIDEFNEKVAITCLDKEIGWAVIAKEAINECDEIIAIYAGKISFGTLSFPSYCMAADIGLRKDSIDAYQFGNITRFIMHLPAQDDVIDLPGLDAKTIARANCQIEKVQIHDHQIPTLKQIQPIKSKEIIGYSYGSNYWLGKSFWLVDKSGQKIVKAQYAERNKIVSCSSYRIT